MQKYFFSLLLFLFPFFVFSENLRVNFNLIYNSKQVYRGALIWDAPIIAFGPTITFFESLTFAGTRISFFKSFSDRHFFSIGSNYFDDDGPSIVAFSPEDEKEDYKNSRSSTFESSISYKFKIKHYFSYTTSFHKDLKRHHGNYINFKISTSIIPFITIGNTVGFGNRSHNHYVYGKEGKSGLAHIDSFISLFLPFLPGSGRLLLSYTHSQIAQGKNQSAHYIRGIYKNDRFACLAIWTL